MSSYYWWKPLISAADFKVISLIVVKMFHSQSEILHSEKFTKTNNEYIEIIIVLFQYYKYPLWRMRENIAFAYGSNSV